ncbi:MAG: hypothetical protein FWD17_19465 [Polyangiaceae bacterium]|nr:hypothetical protein [Polyangiaceae bacterium]
MKAAYGELSLAIDSAKWRFGDAHAEGRLRYGLQGDQQQIFVELREAYVNAYLGPLDIRLGQQIIVWGRADAFNPTSNLTPSDLRIRSPIDDDRRVGNVGARVFLNLLPVRLEGVWMPIYLASELPTIQLPSYVAYDTPKYPQPSLSNGLGAGRVHLELPSFEASVSYLYGYAPLPGISLSNFAPATPPAGVQASSYVPAGPQVFVSRTAYAQHVVGFDFSTALGDILAIRGEAAYRRPVDWQDRVYAPHPDIQYVLGIDRSFGPVNVIAQYMGRYVFYWQRQPGPNMMENATTLANVNPDPTSQPYQLAVSEINSDLLKVNQMLFSQLAQVQHLVTMRVEWSLLHETLSLSALGMVNITTHEWLAAPKISYRISDALTAYVGAELFGGPTGTLFGLIAAEMSAGYAELRFTF